MALVYRYMESITKEGSGVNHKLHEYIFPVLLGVLVDACLCSVEKALIKTSTSLQEVDG